MIIVIARIEFDPQMLAEIEPALEAMMRATWEESGCLGYSMAIENRREGICSIVERWESEVALKSHFTTAHMAAFNEAIMGKVGAIDARIYDAANERQLNF
jgi:quinol monooxygenase YgiN